jgi:hypothetical protein
VRYRADDLYRLLEESGCIPDGERYPCGEVWVSPQGQVFLLPDPDEDAAGERWFDADVIDDNLKDRWLQFGHGMLVRHPPVSA